MECLCKTNIGNRFCALKQICKRFFIILYFRISSCFFLFITSLYYTAAGLFAWSDNTMVNQTGAESLYARSHACADTYAHIHSYTSACTQKHKQRQIHKFDCSVVVSICRFPLFPSFILTLFTPFNYIQWNVFFLHVSLAKVKQWKWQSHSTVTCKIIARFTFTLFSFI